MDYIGRNINFDETRGKYVIFTEVDGVEFFHESDTRALAESRMKMLRVEGYQYIDPLHDKSI